MCPEIILYQYRWFLISPFFGLGIKYTLKPLQANIGISESRFGVYIEPARSRIYNPITSMGHSRPDYHRVQTPTVGGNTFDSSYHRPLDARTSVALCVILTNKDFDRVEHAQHDPRFVHVIDILRQNGRVL